MSTLRYTGALALCATLLSSAAAQAITVDLSTAVLTGGASFIANEGRIKFDPNTPGQTATFTIPSTPGQQYEISVTGQNDQSESFFQFFIDPDGPGPSGFVLLASNVNFGSGFNTIALPPFTDIGAFDFLRIVNGGSGNSEGQIAGVTQIEIRAVPGPIVGAGIPGLVIAFGGLAMWWRRRQALQS